MVTKMGSRMSKLSSTERQHRFVEAQKAAGLRRVVLWARPEDVDALKLAAKQPHSLAKLREEVRADLRKTLEPAIKLQVEAELRRKTERAMLLQRRAQARRALSGANRPPECIRFENTPPAARRNALKAAGWLWDPVAMVWHLPTDPASYEATERLLDALEPFGVVRLTKTEDGHF